MLYDPWLVTLAYVRRHRKLGAADPTKDDPLIMDLIQEASAEFQESVGRIFLPWRGVSLCDYHHPYKVDFKDDVLELVSLTNGDGTALDLTTLMLQPNNSLPAWRAQVKYGSPFFVYVVEPRQAISLDAWRGCVPHYRTGAFKASGVIVPAGNLLVGVTSLVLTAGQGASFETGQYLACTTSGVKELMQITAIVTDTLTLSRGELGTTAALHNSGDALQILVPARDVMAAVREIAVYKYLHKDQVGGKIVTVANGVVMVEDLPKSVQDTVDHYFPHADYFEVV